MPSFWVKRLPKVMTLSESVYSWLSALRLCTIRIIHGFSFGGPPAELLLLDRMWKIIVQRRSNCTVQILVKHSLQKWCLFKYLISVKGKVNSFSTDNYLSVWYLSSFFIAFKTKAFQITFLGYAAIGFGLSEIFDYLR